MPPEAPGVATSDEGRAGRRGTELNAGGGHAFSVLGGLYVLMTVTGSASGGASSGVNVACTTSLAAPTVVLKLKAKGSSNPSAM